MCSHNEVRTLLKKAKCSVTVLAQESSNSAGSVVVVNGFRGILTNSALTVLRFKQTLPLCSRHAVPVLKTSVSKEIWIFFLLSRPPAKMLEITAGLTTASMARSFTSISGEVSQGLRILLFTILITTALHALNYSQQCKSPSNRRQTCLRSHMKLVVQGKGERLVIKRPSEPLTLLEIVHKRPTTLHISKPLTT